MTHEHTDTTPESIFLYVAAKDVPEYMRRLGSPAWLRALKDAPSAVTQQLKNAAYCACEIGVLEAHRQFSACMEKRVPQGHAKEHREQRIAAKVIEHISRTQHGLLSTELSILHDAIKDALKDVRSYLRAQGHGYEAHAFAQHIRRTQRVYQSQVLTRLKADENSIVEQLICRPPARALYSAIEEVDAADSRFHRARAEALTAPQTNIHAIESRGRGVGGVDGPNEKRGLVWKEVAHVMLEDGRQVTPGWQAQGKASVRELLAWGIPFACIANDAHRKLTVFGDGIALLRRFGMGEQHGLAL